MAESNVPDIQIDSVGKTVCPRCGMMVDLTGLSAFAAAECNACQARFAAPGKLGQYVLVKPISHSETAVSFKGFDTSMSRHVEIKVMLKELCSDRDRVRSFQGEARALASIDNRNVARAFFVGDHEGRPYAVTELVEGPSLARLVSPERPLAESRVLKIALDLASVIRDLAAKGLRHGRISPENIIVTGKDSIKLVNFGAESDADDVDHAAAAPHYLAPEQIRGEATDFRTDIYALGATMFHALIGTPPFDGEDAEAVRQAHLTDCPPDVRSLRTSLGQPTGLAVGRMLRAVPDERHASCEALILDLESALGAAKTARLARGGDAAAALSVMTGDPGAAGGGEHSSPGAQARPDRPARPARPRPAPKVEPKVVVKETLARLKTQLARRPVQIGIAAGVAALVGIVVLIVVLSSSSPARSRGGESFSGDGASSSLRGPGLKVIEGFELSGWSLRGGGEFNDGALDLFNGRGADRSVGRRIAPGPFKVRIDLKNIDSGVGRNYDVNVVEAAGAYITFGIRSGQVQGGVHIPGKGWRPVTIPVRMTSPTVTWDLSFSPVAGGVNWSASYTTGDGKRGKLTLGQANEGHLTSYIKSVRPNAARTIEIVSRGRSARMSVDHYEQTAGKK